MMITWKRGDKCYVTNPEAVLTFLCASTSGMKAITEFDGTGDICVKNLIDIKPVPSKEDTQIESIFASFTRIEEYKGWDKTKSQVDRRKELIRHMLNIGYSNSTVDVAHLHFIYNRIAQVHGENHNLDYMRKFYEIILELGE